MLIWWFYNTFAGAVNEDFWYFEKHKNLHFSKSKKTQNTEYNQNNVVGEPEINTAIWWFSQSHSTGYGLNIVTTIFNQ